MSGGSPGLGGYIYQQYYVTFRVLASAASGGMEGNRPGRRVESYAVEGRATDEGPAWDVKLVLSDPGPIELLECKDTAITRKDRLVFYRRLRREYAAGTDFGRLTAGWVTDPVKQGQGKILSHFREMAVLADGYQANHPPSSPEEVNSGESALHEALFCLTAVDSQGNFPPIPLDIAKALLARLRIDLIASTDLRMAVEAMAREVFDQGTGPALRRLFIANLTDEIVQNGSAEGTVDALLKTVGGDKVFASAREGLRTFLNDHSYAATLPSVQPIRWERLGGQSIEWPLSARLPGFDPDRSALLVGRQGSGKSTACLQAVRELANGRNCHHVLWVDAGTFRREFIRRLPGFVAVLSGVSPTWIAVDGLDRIDRESREAWEDCLGRLPTIPGLVLLAAAREEVLTSGEWLQRLTASLPSLPLADLDAEQVRSAFRAAGLDAPQSGELLRVLGNPLLLSLYARIADRESLPFGAGGRITAFRVVQEFWKRRVRPPSEGHRLAGPEDDSAAAKRAAVLHLVEETLRGTFVIRVPASAERVERGIRMLAREGVILERGTHAIHWFHDWIREFALVDYLIADIERATPAALAEKILGLANDHVARTAAVAGAKWAITELDWGPVEVYLEQLHARRPGHASEALAALLEESPAHLELGRLSDPLLEEAVGMARQMGNKSWLGQISSLPPGRFRGAVGARLLLAVSQYELEMSPDE